jgi:GntR family transcriptional regulator, transcriptional repressor for pyruvate dehydrogenase complex
MRRNRLADAVVAELAAGIVAGRLTEGTVLPAEPQLCTRFRVSRTVVREATARLAGMGLVRINQGSGTTVLGREQWHDLAPELIQIRAANGLIADLARDLLEVRRIVEVEVAGYAALRRSDELLAHLATLLDLMEARNSDPVGYTDADLAFHDALLVASGNVLLQQIMRPVNELRRVGSVITASRDRSLDRFTAAMEGHRAIFAAVAIQDAAAAREAMALHVAQFEGDLMETMTSAAPEAVHDCMVPIGTDSVRHRLAR